MPATLGTLGRGQALALGPGIVLCIAVTVAALWLQGFEALVFGRPWLEALVLAILLGAAVRVLWTPGPAWRAGVDFSAKTLLEIAVVLLGATLDVRTIAAHGLALIAGVAALVVVAVPTGYAVGRALGLPRRMSILVACGNAICGNSAIAAVAPVIGAESEDVTASIAFTAVLGVVVVLALPLLAGLLHFNHRAFGVYAGLTVYAVPQVIAATAPVSPLSAQVGTLVKLVRVLMLGPLVVVLSMLGLDERPAAASLEASAKPAGVRRLPLRRLVPWFIVGFLLLAGARSAGLTPTAVTASAGVAAAMLTIVSMAALGLAVDVRALARAGPRVSATVTLSLVVLGLLALALVRILNVG
jgi:uncharacterized integral membrane protein (TIGR00698 family)